MKSDDGYVGEVAEMGHGGGRWARGRGTLTAASEAVGSAPAGTPCATPRRRIGS